MRRLNQESCQIQFKQTLRKDSKMQDKLKNTSKSNGRWTKEEHLNFLEGLRIYGKNWKKIEQLVKTRSGSQIRSHAQKFFLKNKLNQSLDEQEDYPVSGDLQEYPEEITGNSKSICETALRKEDFSYYLEKIMQYSSGTSDLNFWEALVDCKGVVNNSAHPSQKKSFMNLKEEESGAALQQLDIQKIKV